MWQLNGFFLFYIISIQSSHVSNAASDLYVQPGRNVTIPCLLNITKSNIGSLYWQKINNSTQGFETVYSFIKFANGPGWRSPLRGYVVNFTDLVLLNVTFSHDGVYNCKILTHSAPRIYDRETYLHVILPMLDIEVRKSKARTVISNGEVIQILHGEETDVECAVVGSVSPPVELRWITSEDHNQTRVYTSMPHGPSSTVKLNGSRVTHEENITCRAVQWISGRPYLTIETTFILKRLDPRIEISNCTTQVHSQPGDCCLINVSSNQSKNSVFFSNLTCEAKNIVSSGNLTWFLQLGNQSKEIETTEGYAVSAVPDPGNINTIWTCSFKDHQGETWNMSACLYSNLPPGHYIKGNAHGKTIAATITSLVILLLLVIIGIIVFIVWRKKRNKEEVVQHSDINFEHTPMVTSDDMHAGNNDEDAQYRGNRDEHTHMIDQVDLDEDLSDTTYFEAGPPSHAGSVKEKAPELPVRNVRGANAPSARMAFRTPPADEGENSVQSDAVNDNSNPTPIPMDNSNIDAVDDNSNPIPSPRLNSDIVDDNRNSTPISSDYEDTAIPAEIRESSLQSVGNPVQHTYSKRFFKDRGDDRVPSKLLAEFDEVIEPGYVENTAKELERIMLSDRSPAHKGDQ